MTSCFDGKTKEKIDKNGNCRKAKSWEMTCLLKKLWIFISTISNTSLENGFKHTFAD